jgi:mRNA interferase MazF
MKTCKRGEIWLVSFDPTRGSEQSGTRPAIIIQNDIGNRYGSTTIVAAISSRVKKYPHTLVLDVNSTNGLSQISCLKLDQLLTIDKERLIKKIGTISNQKISELDFALQLSLGLV